jgi:hypothetical protein
MIDFDTDDNPSPVPTFFDLERLDCMEEGDSLEGECGLWKVLKYENDYTLIWGGKIKDFRTLNQLISYLSKQ